jgi:hypothetical protein
LQNYSDFYAVKKALLSVLLIVSCTVASAQARTDTARRERNIRPCVFSSLSYQLAVNGSEADSDLGNFGFKGYVQPEIGLGLKYQQDSTEFAIVGLSATRFVFSLASQNRLIDNGTEYPVSNRVDVYMNNYALSTTYHRRLTYKKPAYYFAFEAGVGVHLLQWYGTVHSDDVQVGPYYATHKVSAPKDLYALPSATIGLNCVMISDQRKSNFVFGVTADMYLGKFNEINYQVQYTSPTETLNQHFRWSPVILAPKVYVMALF